MSWIESQAELAKRGIEVSTQPRRELKCFLRVHGDRVIIQQDDLKQESRIIYQPKEKETKPTTGRIIAVPVGLEEWLGQKILFAQFSGVALNFKHVHNWRILETTEILAFFDDPESTYELDTNVV